MMTNYNVIMTNTDINITYYGELESSSNSIYIVYGYENEWINTTKLLMKKVNDVFTVSIKKTKFNILNFCFCNEKEAWDNNNGNNYSVEIDKSIKNNGTLLISEIQNKIFLPYTVQEVEEIVKDQSNKYSTSQEVIESVFTRQFTDYKHQFICRFKESIDLITKREHRSYLDGIKLGTELFGKRCLHPAIISACKSVDELDIYIDCLEKNELDDFKIFKIEYEMLPMTIKKTTI